MADFEARSACKPCGAVSEMGVIASAALAVIFPPLRDDVDILLGCSLLFVHTVLPLWRTSLSPLCQVPQEVAAHRWPQEEYMKQLI